MHLKLVTTERSSVADWRLIGRNTRPGRLSGRARSFSFAVAMLLAALAALPAPMLAASADVMQAALAEFAGDPPEAKNGPMVKIGLDLVVLFEEFRATPPNALYVPSNPLIQLVGDKVVVDVVAAGDSAALESELRALGMHVTGRFGRMVSGMLPISALADVAASPNVQFAQPASGQNNAGLVTSQGVRAMRVDALRSLTVNGVPIDGRGVTVGVLSDSFDCLGGAAADVASGDLSPVTVLQDEPGCVSGLDEGRAMLQIVHDVAPAASLQFAAALNVGQAGFANNIQALAAAGSDVIVDDDQLFAEPMFQDGVIAQAVDTVVAQGVAYFSSAGNDGRRAYQSAFASGGVLAAGSLASAGGAPFFFGGDAHDFDPGAGVDVFQSITIPPGSKTVVVLQWDQPFFSVSGAPGAASDLDIYLVNTTTSTVSAGSANSNIGGDALEIFQFVNSGAVPATRSFLITRRSGPVPNLIKMVWSTQVSPDFTVNEFATNSGTIYGHANAAGAEAVGEADYYRTPAFGVSPPLLNPDSAAGTTPILFTITGMPTLDPRADKPEIVAPTGGNNTFFGSDIADPGDGSDTDTFPNFFGTSAAAPHAAGVAALMRQVSPSSSPATIYSTLESTAIDMGTPGFDNDSGFGLIQAAAAVCTLVPCRGSTAPALSWPALAITLAGLALIGWWRVNRGLASARARRTY